MRKHTNLRLTVVAALLALMLGYLLSGCTGGPHSSPESVARAYVEAVAAGDCQRAASYMSPDQRANIRWSCGSEAGGAIISARIDDVVVVREYPMVVQVKLLGEFVVDRVGFRYTGDSYSFVVEQLDGKWYVRSD